LDDLFIAVDKYPDTTAVKAAAILKAWDKKTDAASKGALLFSGWFEKMTPAMFAIPWNRKEPVSTPDGLKDQQQAVTLLVKAADETEKKYGTMDKAWGDVYRLRLNGIDLPASGGLQQQGIFMSLTYTEDKDNKYRADGGETYIAVTEFGKPVKAQVLLGYGNSSQPGSKHIGDQLELLSQKKLRPAWITRKDVLNNLEKKEVLNITGFN
jgi:acyl-homoserine-lactone acylase